MSCVPYTTRDTTTRGKFTVPHVHLSTVANGESPHMGVQLSSQDLGWSNGNADAKQPQEYVLYSCDCVQCPAHIHTDNLGVIISSNDNNKQ
jgi:hypothetical protein